MNADAVHDGSRWWKGDDQHRTHDDGLHDRSASILNNAWYVGV